MSKTAWIKIQICVACNVLIYYKLNGIFLRSSLAYNIKQGSEHVWRVASKLAQLFYNSTWKSSILLYVKLYKLCCFVVYMHDSYLGAQANQTEPISAEHDILPFFNTKG